MTGAAALRRRLVRASAVAVVAFAVMGGGPTSAHPLGNFSVNHLDQLTFEPDRIVVDAVVDTAEIPTAQAIATIDANDDGVVSPPEFAAHGSDRCDELAAAVSLTVDGGATQLSVDAANYEHREGEAGLPTGRLECTLTSPVDLSVPRTVRFEDTFESQRVGWREIVAVGRGVTLVDSPVPTVSATDDLSTYPVELLDDPSDVRDASFVVEPGPADTVTSEVAPPTTLGERGPLSSIVDRVTDRFNDLVGREDLTLGVGLLAVSLALVLGASHAMLPGHGKTVMAAYIAGRQGSARDAVIVGSTVTITHTGGVLALGLALTVSSSLAGESVIGWLGVISGLLIAGLGGALLVGAVRHRPSLLDAHGHHHGHGHHHHDGHGHDGHGHDGHSHDGHTHDGHSHDHDHDSHHHDGHSHDGHTHDHDHDGHHHDGHSHDGHSHGGQTHDQQHDPRQVEVLAAVGSSAGGAAATILHRSDEHVHPHEGADEGDLLRHDHHHDHDHDHDHDDLQGRGDQVSTDHDHASADHGSTSRRGLVGMGVAGGLVPSPSALVVLLSAIALGRTAFGVLLVLAYGVGMAATLTAAGLLLVVLRDRFQSRTSKMSGRAKAAAARWGRIMPYATAALVLVVGLGLAVQGLDTLR